MCFIGSGQSYSFFTPCWIAMTWQLVWPIGSGRWLGLWPLLIALPLVAARAMAHCYDPQNCICSCVQADSKHFGESKCIPLNWECEWHFLCFSVNDFSLAGN